MEAALIKYEAGKYLNWTTPSGGLFFFVEAINQRINMSVIREKLHENNVEIVPSSACRPPANEFNEEKPDNGARLNFTGIKRDFIDEAVRRFVAQVEQAHLDLNLPNSRGSVLFV